MGLFKKKQRATYTELKCPAEGCPMTCSDSTLRFSRRRHVDSQRREKDGF